VADVARPTSLAAQILLIARLRWTIFRSRLRQRNAAIELIGLLITGLFSALFILGTGTGIAVGGYFIAAKNRLDLLNLLFWGIFLAWHFFPVMMSSFTVQFDFRSLLRFPLSLPAFYILSVAYGLADPAALGSLFWCVCLLGGVGFARPELLPAATLVVAVFAAMNVVLDRMIGVWLERLLAQRRTREALVALFILAMVGLQFSGMIGERWGPRLFSRGQAVLPYLRGLPPSLAGTALEAAAKSHPAILFASTAGLAGYGVLFGYFLWRRLRAQYCGEELSESRAPGRSVSVAKRPAEAAGTPSAITAWLPGPVAAMAEKELRYLVRNSITLMNLFVPPLVSVFLAYQLGHFSRIAARPGPAPAPSQFLFPGLIGYILLLVTAPAYNCFAYDGRGIQTYLVVPVRFREILLGKNLATGLVLAFEALLTGTLLSFLIGLPPFAVLMATLSGVVFVTLVQLTVGNLTSLYYPRRLEFGQLRNQRASGITVLVLLGMQFALILVISVVFLVTRWLAGLWATFALFLVLSAGAAGIYGVILEKCSAVAVAQREVLTEKLIR
jgi:ABC-2 type transport system permease protein